MLPDDLRETRARYRERHRRFGYDPRTLGWSKGTQQVRFAAALEGLPAFGRIVDVGCGFGDLFGFLRRRGFRGTYLGIDVVPELLEEGRRRHGKKGARFLCADPSREPVDFRADAAIALGLFNHRLRQDNLTAAFEAIGAMWRMATKVVVADFLSVTADRRREDLFYADPGAVLERALRLGRRAVLHHAYMPFEFMVKVWHDDAFTVPRPVFRPYRRWIARG